MRLLPEIDHSGTCISADDFQAEGRTLTIRWLGIVVEISLLRETDLDGRPMGPGEWIG
ncbi:hypothetical protein [Aurantiacibacter xanthus]|uniref:hypothetical protein n=1 Tax=Aurantiacibacter xanthus TaxID=1784712 RepID=UPI00174B004B|nr:hypothetical protein [Aurantiacibacter xanthus]